jgi:enoyl-CoA hydratase
MDLHNIVYKEEKGIARLVVNRPEKRNALNRATRLEMAEVLDNVEADESVRVLIVSGEGEKSFIAGSDLTELSRFSPLEMEEFISTLGQRLYNRFEEMEKPVIAMIDGLCLGGGLELAMACDIRIASDRSRFGQPEISLGIIPGSGGTQRLSRLVGTGKAREIIYTGNPIDAEEAHRIGLVNQVLPSAELEAAVMEMACAISEKSRLALKWAKRAINMSQQSSQQVGLGYEGLAEALLFSSQDRQEGMRAFLEKRKPRFSGK